MIYLADGLDIRIPDNRHNKRVIGFHGHTNVDLSPHTDIITFHARIDPGM